MLFSKSSWEKLSCDTRSLGGRQNQALGPHPSSQHLRHRATQRFENHWWRTKSAMISHILEAAHFNQELAILLVILACVYVLKFVFIHLGRQCSLSGQPHFFFCLAAFRKILLPAVTWRSCFDHFENAKVLHKCKAKRAHKGTNDVPLFDFYLSGYESYF